MAQPIAFGYAGPCASPFEGRLCGDNNDRGKGGLEIPVIDLSMLVSGGPDEKSRMIRDLRMACQEWGFFMLINHGVPESLMSAMEAATREFFDLPEDEKRKYAGKGVVDTVRYGTSFASGTEGGHMFFWRDFVKALVRPQFHSPSKPQGFSNVLAEYCEKMHVMGKVLLEGISESLGLDTEHINKMMDIESSQQLWAANRYPPCPDPESVMGIPAHTDYGLLTFLTQHGTDGLEIFHQDKWVEVHPIKGAILVNTCDHIEIITNGKYKSVLHRAKVNTEKTRISIVSSIGPSPDTFVRPIEELLEEGKEEAKYMGMKYREYFDLMYDPKLFGKSCLEYVKTITTRS
ncbi:hypothetical protein MLD38_022944 [Melastoma candidum]|uniref:Uncharacterized protein n=1 Tax=Melastoma candidum TaxID=119954 RepID=A0ACB9QU46_9MYRT|nr:hypothetical protein MLD38_022944 [Melastoma candidum]